jgi:hypothetical protein
MKTKSASTGLAKQKWTRGIVKMVKIVVYAVLIYVVIYRVVERTVAYDFRHSIRGHDADVISGRRFLCIEIFLRL